MTVEFPTPVGRGLYKQACVDSFLYSFAFMSKSRYDVDNPSQGSHALRKRMVPSPSSSYDDVSDHNEHEHVSATSGASHSLTLVWEEASRHPPQQKKLYSPTQEQAQQTESGKRRRDMAPNVLAKSPVKKNRAVK